VLFRSTECEATAAAIVRAGRSSPGKPVHACFIGGQRVREAMGILRAGGIPAYESPASAVGGIRAMVEYARWRQRPKRVVRLFPVNRRKVEKIIHRSVRAGRLAIGQTETRDILEAYGFVTPRAYVATTAQQAVGFAEQMGYPVTLSVWSAQIPHAGEVGGARTPLTGEQAILDAFDLIMYRVSRLHPEARILGVRVQETCQRGRQVLLGMNRDEHFGPLMTVGAGGTLEVLREAAFYLAPLTAEEAKDMLLRTRTYQLLTGGSDRPGVDIDAIAEGLQRLSQLATEFPQIEEVDINPYVVGEAGTTPVAVDAHIRVASG
jgi:acetyltransferase